MTSDCGVASVATRDTARLVPGSQSASAGLHRQREFPGEECQLQQVRRWLACLVPGDPMRSDVASVATELCSNAIRHSASGRGGTFIVDVTLAASSLRITVGDGGGAT